MSDISISQIKQATNNSVETIGLGINVYELVKRYNENYYLDYVNIGINHLKKYKHLIIYAENDEISNLDLNDYIENHNISSYDVSKIIVN